MTASILGGMPKRPKTAHKSTIDGVIGFGKVDKAHEQRGVLLPRQFLQASHHDHHVDRRAVGSKSTLLLQLIWDTNDPMVDFGLGLRSYPARDILHTKTATPIAHRLNQSL